MDSSNVSFGFTEDWRRLRRGWGWAEPAVIVGLCSAIVLVDVAHGLGPHHGASDVHYLLAANASLVQYPLPHVPEELATLGPLVAVSTNVTGTAPAAPLSGQGEYTFKL